MSQFACNPTYLHNISRKLPMTCIEFRENKAIMNQPDFSQMTSVTLIENDLIKSCYMTNCSTLDGNVYITASKGGLF